MKNELKNEDDLVELKTLYMWNNIMVFIFTKRYFSYFDSCSWYVQVECLIFTILTLTECLQNLLSDSTLSVISIA